MAFPAIASTAQGNSGASTQSHTVNLPSGIQAGDLLVVWFVTDGSPTITFPGGWTKLVEVASSGAVTGSLYYKTASGSEGSSISVSTDANEGSAHISFRIPSWNALEASTGATGADAAPDPGSLSPSWGAADTLWIAFECADNGTRTISWNGGDPYTSDRAQEAWSSSQGCVASCRSRQYNAASDDPPSVNLSSADQWVAFTLAVQPAGSSNRKLQVSAVELETPDPPRRLQLSALELETPDEPRRLQLSAAELEVPDVPPRRLQLSALELETPEPARRLQLSAVELELPPEPRRIQLSALEFEQPDAPSRLQLSAAELETPDEARRLQISAAEFELPAWNRQLQLSAIELELPEAPTNDRKLQLSAAELEVPTLAVRLQVSAAEFETPDAARRLQLAALELELPDQPRQLQVSGTEFELPSTGAKLQVSAVELQLIEGQQHPKAQRRRRWHGRRSIHWII